MACLSIFEGHVFTVCANPIFPLDEPDWRDGTTLTFEVLEADADVLFEQVKMVRQYALDGQAFTGKLDSLEECISTHPGLGLLGNDRTLRGVFTIQSLP
jgi:hypothetical protein